MYIAAGNLILERSPHHVRKWPVRTPVTGSGTLATGTKNTSSAKKNRDRLWSLSTLVLSDKRVMQLLYQ